MDDSQKISDNAIPVQTAEAPSSPVSSPLISPTPTVDSIPKSVFRKHTSPLSFKSLSVIILALLLGSVFAVSQLSSKRDSMDVRSRASKKEDKNMLQNGYFERDLLNWKQSKKSNDVTIAIATDKKSQGTKSVKIVNAGGTDAYVYQDVKVEAGTWYTIRADALKSTGNGEVKVEVTEYDMVGGNPKFNPNKLSSRVYTGTDFQTRPMIFKTGKAEVTLAPQNLSLVSKVYAQGDTCTISGRVGVCTLPSGCTRGETYPNTTECGTWDCCVPKVTPTPTPSVRLCNASVVGECGRQANCPNFQECIAVGFSERERTYECRSTTKCADPRITLTPTPLTKQCGDTDTSGGCGPAGGCRSGIRCVWGRAGGPQCSGSCTGPSGGGGTRDTTTPPPAPPARSSGCQSDKECIDKYGANNTCQSDGQCVRQGVNCGTVCYDPSQGVLTPEQEKQIDLVCNQGDKQEEGTEYFCAASTDGTGRRVCWGNKCSADGGQGGGGKADKYVRVLLHMNKAGTAYFDNVRFEKGRVDTGVKIKSTAPTVATVGTALSYQLVTEDAEKDFLTYGLGNAPCPIGKPKCKKDAPPTPSGATITQTGMFTFTPTASGAANIRLWATDGLLPGIQNLQLTVSP